MKHFTRSNLKKLLFLARTLSGNGGETFARALILSLALYTPHSFMTPDGSTLLGFFEAPFKGKIGRENFPGKKGPGKFRLLWARPMRARKKNKKSGRANRVCFPGLPFPAIGNSEAQAIAQRINRYALQALQSPFLLLLSRSCFRLSLCYLIRHRLLISPPCSLGAKKRNKQGGGGIPPPLVCYRMD